MHKTLNAPRWGRAGAVRTLIEGNYKCDPECPW